MVLVDERRRGCAHRVHPREDGDSLRCVPGIGCTVARPELIPPGRPIRCHRRMGTARSRSMIHAIQVGVTPQPRRAVQGKALVGG